MEINIKEAVLEVVSETSWLSLLEIRQKLPPDTDWRKVKGILFSLVKEKVLVYRTDGGDGNSRYATKENADVSLIHRRKADMSGLPWVKFPNTAEACDHLAELLGQIDPHDDIKESLDTLIHHLLILGQRLRDAV